MKRRSPWWVCKKQSEGQKCLTKNPSRKRKCEACGAPKPPARRPKHMVALEADYSMYVELNGGDRCAICLRERGEKDRRFDRDHDHRTGQPRGLLCHKCNRLLQAWVTPAWLRAAADYLEARS